MSDLKFRKLLPDNKRLYEHSDGSFVVASVAENMDHGFESMLFRADSDGNVLSWEALDVGFGVEPYDLADSYAG